MDDFDNIAFEELDWVVDDDMDTAQEIWSEWEWDDIVEDS